MKKYIACMAFILFSKFLFAQLRPYHVVFDLTSKDTSDHNRLSDGRNDIALDDLLNGAFEPMVLVSTKRIKDKIEITVKDNGTGIPQKVLDKIFQPFFTTKPTGQGTGLGLSLSYDIIKAHGGQIRVDTKEGEGVEFVIQLPLKEMV